MTQHKRCVANLALHWEHQSHFNQGYWGGVRLGRHAEAFKDLTNKICRRDLGAASVDMQTSPINFESILTTPSSKSV